MKTYLSPKEFCQYPYAFRSRVAQAFGMVRSGGNYMEDNVLFSDGHSGEELMTKFNVTTIKNFLGTRADDVNLENENALHILLTMLEKEFMPVDVVPSPVTVSESPVVEVVVEPPVVSESPVSEPPLVEPPVSTDPVIPEVITSNPPSDEQNAPEESPPKRRGMPKGGWPKKPAPSVSAETDLQGSVPVGEGSQHA